MDKQKGCHVFILELTPYMEGFFGTEWYNSYHDTKKRTDIDDNTKNAICEMYARMLRQIWSQSLEYHKKVKEEKSYQGIQTPEFVDKMISILEKQLEEVK